MGKSLVHILREHATHTVVGGIIVGLTGFAPEEWLAHTLQDLHISRAATHLWDAGVDVRVVPISVGMAIITLGIMRHYRTTVVPVAALSPDRSTLRDDQIKSAAGSLSDSITDGSLASTKPAIAVLAFNNMSENRDQDYFSDGVTEDIITQLSRSRSLLVTARNSSFTYKGHAVDVKEIARELSVRYVLEGSVRLNGQHLRVNAQLIDAESGSHIWAHRYDADLSDLFVVQDEITTAVALAIEPAVSEAEQQRAARKLPENLDAWESYQRGLSLLTHINASENERSREFFRRAIDLDPTFSLPHQGLARTYTDEASAYQTRTASDAVKLALPLAIKAVELDPSDANGHGLLGYVWLINGELEKGLARAEIALEINSNAVVALQTKGSCLVFMGKYESGADILRDYLRRNPRDPWNFRAYNHLAIACYELSDYTGCIDAAQHAIQSNVNFYSSYRWLAAALGQLNRVQQAQDVIARVSAIISPTSFNEYANYRGPWISERDHGRMLDGLRLAGWQGKADDSVSVT